MDNAKKINKGVSEEQLKDALLTIFKALPNKEQTQLIKELRADFKEGAK